MRKLTVNQFVNLVKDADNHTFAGIVTEKTEKTLKKSRATGEPVTDRVTSRTFYNPVLGLTYQNTVNNRLSREGKEADFVAASLPYGEWYGTGHTIIKHKDSFQLRLSIVAADTKKHWFLNGKEVSRKEIADILPAPKAYSADRQGLDNPVVVNNIKIETITRISFKGEEFSIAESETPELRAPWTEKKETVLT
jgi:hypothetical protein